MIEFTYSTNLLSPSWWVAYIIDFAQREPTHLAVEVICGAVILYLIFSKEYKINDGKVKLSKKEEDELIQEWTPEGLIPKNFVSVRDTPLLLVENGADAVAVINGEEYLNLSSYNFAGIATNKEIREGCAEVIKEYGVGSCGPRGFYGTIDQHIEIEKTASKFMGTEDAILYSDSLGCVSSVIPAFAKTGDIIVVDEFANFGIQQGCKLSRSKVIKYKHNDMEDLERIMKSITQCDKGKDKKTKLNRRFVITEGISQNTGIIANIKDITALKYKYKFRTIVDDSLAIGVLGATGRGSFEHHGLKVDDLDIICFTLDTTLAAVGGICVGSKQVVSHQRLSGAGYCFSAASPPYTARAATLALGLIDSNPDLCAAIREKAKYFRSQVTSIPGFTLRGGVSGSPVVHMDLTDVSAEKSKPILKTICDRLRENYIIAFPTGYLPTEKDAPVPSIRFNVSILLANVDIDTAVEQFKAIAASVIE